MAETYSAGIVTAYGAAVRGGYTGTYEQWCQDMANLGANVAEVRTKAAQAAQSAENAAGSATAAAGSAGSAAGSASEAASSAGNAAGSATAAAESATAAAGSASNAASSATAASASATAAGNAQTAAETAQGKAEDAQEAAEQAQSDAEAAAQSVSQSAAQIATNTQDIGALKSAVNDPVTGLDSKAPAVIDTASGAIASFPDGADGLPVKKLTVQIVPTQAGTGDPSPDNVRPISGWTGAKVANISDSEKQPYFAGLLNGTYGFVDLGTLEWVKYNSGNNRYYFAATVNGVKGAAYSAIPNMICSKYSAVMFNSIYSNTNNGIGTPLNGNEVSVYDSNYIGGDASTFKAAMSGVYLVYELATPTTPTIAQAQYNILLQSFNLGGWFAPISWQSEAGTVYGGTLTINDDGTGTLVSNVIYGTFNNETIVYYNQTFQLFYFLLKSGIVDYPAATVINIHNPQPFTVISNLYPTANSYGVDVQNKTIALGAPGNFGDFVCVKNADYTNSGDFMAAMISQGMTVAYLLREDFWETYQLTQQQVIDTLYGTNNIWADCGDIEIEYRADTKLYIQKINAPADDDMTADAQIASGKYFIVGGNLYLSTTTIPAGDTIIPGTNCQKTNLAEALNALNT